MKTSEGINRPCVVNICVVNIGLEMCVSVTGKCLLCTALFRDAQTRLKPAASALYSTWINVSPGFKLCHFLSVLKSSLGSTWP